MQHEGLHGLTIKAQMTYRVCNISSWFTNHVYNDIKYLQNHYTPPTHSVFLSYMAFRWETGMAARSFARKAFCPLWRRPQNYFTISLTFHKYMAALNHYCIRMKLFTQTPTKLLAYPLTGCLGISLFHPTP